LEALLLFLMCLLLLGSSRPELGQSLRKGVAEFWAGLEWHRAEMEATGTIGLARGVVGALSLGLLVLLALTLRGLLR